MVCYQPVRLPVAEAGQQEDAQPGVQTRLVVSVVDFVVAEFDSEGERRR